MKSRALVSLVTPAAAAVVALALWSCDKPRSGSTAPADPAKATQATTAKKAEPAAPVAKASPYPASRREDVTDLYHGVKVADPYRWLEKIDSQETKSWINAQVQTTNSHLQGIASRQLVTQMLEKAWNYERFGLPHKEGKRYFVAKNSGLQNQPVLYWSDSLKGDMKELLNPNTLSQDGTVALSGTQVSRDGKYLAYGLSSSGSDWQTWYVRDVGSGRDMGDKIEWVKFSGAEWSADNKGFYYARFEAPKPGEALSATNYNQKLYYHVLGTPQTQDRLVYERPDQPEWGFGPTVTEDGRYLFIRVTQGTDRRVRLFYQDLRQPLGSRKTVELISELEASYQVLGNRGSRIYVKTNEGAPRGRVVEIDLRKPEKANWKELIPESEDKLAGTHYTGDMFFANYLKDARSVVKVFDRRGKLRTDVALPGIGSAYGFGGDSKSKETFFSYSSFNRPSTIYRYDIRRNKSEIFKQPKLSFNPDDFVTEQVFYTSKDGTKVPMSISYKKGTKRDGKTPTYLYGYGGFGISLTPSFSVPNLVWMQLGGIYVQANLRGGGEYGKTWHEAGIKTNKQNVFDDFIAAAQWLINAGYTNKDKLAIGGRSNGGLLVAAALTQRPDLFAAALPGVGVLDMLRFPEFTIGRAWTSDYGSPKDPQEFKTLLSYSPYHNTKPGTKYPATLVYTADHDDRVYPAHSFKFAAALQHAQAGQAPTLIRIEQKAGHGSGMPTSKRIAQWADLWAFLTKHLDMSVSSSAIATPQTTPQTSTSQGSAPATGR